jgi:D-alanyl-lipoteichoic acid acyltransferase DltB (MBOAT superfamily)
VLFPTVAFAVFFCIAFVANWLLRPAFGVWLAVLTAMSLVFYGWTDARFVALLVGSAVVNWGFGELIDRSADPRALVRLAVAVNLVFLGIFKYYGFFVDSFVDAAAAIGIDLRPPLLEIALPVGISFITFHAISYVIDVGRRTIRPMPLGDFMLYMSFFPHLVAGPIVRAREFGPQIRRTPDPRDIPAAEAFRLIAAGLFKKVVVSSYLASELVDPVFGAPEAHGRWELVVAVYAYAIQIYADFSGYTDIAIGCALLLGFRFPQNFDAPYRALSLQDFWRRWHMTLSRWLRDYLYIPLGGSRDGVNRTYRNLFLTMVLGGLWHGAAWQFVVWGALHGGYLVAERRVRAAWAVAHPQPVLPGSVTRVLQWALTFHVVCLAWIFFRADSLGTAFDVIGGIATSVQPSPLVTGLVLLVVVAAIASQFVPTRAVEAVQSRFGLLAPGTQAVALAGALTVIDVLGPDGVAPFIYFRF